MKASENEAAASRGAFSDNWMACPSCDWLHNLADLPDHSTARCHRCHTVLSRKDSRSNLKLVSYSLTGLVALTISLSFPFMEFSRAGFENSTTLPAIIAALWNNDMRWLAALVAGFIVAAPAVTLLLMLYVGASLHWMRAGRHLRSVSRLVFHCANWSMAEVFFIGVLVSLIKLSKLADLGLGPAFWSYALFALFFTLVIITVDRFQIWRQVDGLAK
ncbi:MAG: paraquat-inducible protein A [Pseudomonadota bacterium]